MCEHGSLRLEGGVASNKGQLEICINNMWGTICNDSFDNNAAKVACTQMGYEIDEGQSRKRK